MAITVTEKEHWRSRLERKIERAIQDLLAKENPDFLKNVAATAREVAINTLGIRELIERQKNLAKEKQQIEAGERRAIRKLLAKAKGKEVDDIDYPYDWESQVERVIHARQKSIEHELMEADPLGQKILKLRAEEEELLDTVWLATSTQQIRTLWQSLTELLAGELTPLQHKAINTPPVKEAND